MLLRCCLIHITITILRPILFLVYLCPCLGLGLFMSNLCDLFFIFSLIFIVIIHITLFKHTYLLFRIFPITSDNVDEESKQFSNSKSSASGCCLAFVWSFPNFSLTLLVNVLLKKAYSVRPQPSKLFIFSRFSGPKVA